MGVDIRIGEQILIIHPDRPPTFEICHTIKRQIDFKPSVNSDGDVIEIDNHNRWNNSYFGRLKTRLGLIELFEDLSANTAYGTDLSEVQPKHYDALKQAIDRLQARQAIAQQEYYQSDLEDLQWFVYWIDKTKRISKKVFIEVA